MATDLFSSTKERAKRFAENIWLSQLLYETIENLAEYELKYEAAINSEDEVAMNEAKLQIDATIASLQLASYMNEATQEGS